MSQARMCGMYPRVCSKLGAQSVTFLHVRYAVSFRKTQSSTRFHNHACAVFAKVCQLMEICCKSHPRMCGMHVNLLCTIRKHERNS